MLNQKITATTRINKNHHNNCNATKRVQTLQPLLVVLHHHHLSFTTYFIVLLLSMLHVPTITMSQRLVGESEQCNQCNDNNKWQVNVNWVKCSHNFTPIICNGDVVNSEFAQVWLQVADGIGGVVKHVLALVTGENFELMVLGCADFKYSRLGNIIGNCGEFCERTFVAVGGEFVDEDFVQSGGDVNVSLIDL